MEGLKSGHRRSPTINERQTLYLFFRNSVYYSALASVCELLSMAD